MRRWIGFAAALYPRSWRAEFGAEFRAVLDETKPSWRVFANVLRGAIEMRMRSGNSGVRLVAAVAVVGALAGFAVSNRVAPVYVSSVTISVTPVVDPARPVSAEVAQEHVAQRVEEMQTEVMSRAKLAAVIDDSRLRLYETERRTKPLEDVIAEMRRGIRIETVPSTKRGVAATVLSISFAYPDASKAQATAGTLAEKFIEANLNRSLTQQRVYRVRPPVGEVAAVLSAASLPVKAESNRFAFVGWGLAIGIAMGLMAAVTIRWPRPVRRIAAFGAAACALALPASFLIPNRYTSTAVMQIEPATLIDDAALPAVSATEFLRQIEPDVMSTASLAALIQNRRLELYNGGRGSETMEEVVRKMRADLRITPIQQGSTFRISFTYIDRFKAQQAVQTMIALFELANQEKALTRAPGSRRRAAEVLGVLDVPDLPATPVYPNRLMIVLTGGGLGMLLGGISLRFRWPGNTTGAPAQSAEISGTDLHDQAAHFRSMLNRLLIAG